MSAQSVLLLVLLLFLTVFYLDEQTLTSQEKTTTPWYFSSSVSNKYGSTPELAPVHLAVKEKALRKSGNDAVRSVVIQSCAWLEGLQFTRLAN